MPSTYDYEGQERIKRQQEAAQASMAKAAGAQQERTAAYQSAASSPSILTNAGSAYKPSDAVSAAWQYLDEQKAGKPGGYSSKYGGQLEGILSQLQGREQFSYDAAADPLYQIYKDMYIQNGRRAMQDTIGNAAALAGGYGSSYAQSAGQQAYNQYMEGLNSVVPQLQQQAYQRYADEGDKMVQVFQMMNALENQNYNQYRDTVADWQLERQLAQQAAFQAWQMDMQQYQYDSDLAYKYYGTDLDEAYRRDTLAEDMRQYDADLAYKYYGTDKDDAYKYAELAEKARQYDTTFAEDQRLNDRAFDYQKERDLVSDTQWQADFDETKRINDRNYNRQIARDEVSDKQWQADYDSNEFWKQKNYDYQTNRDAVEDAWNQKLYDQSEQHYQDTRADSQRQWEHSLEREAVEDAWNQKLYDQSEQHYQDTRADSQRNWEHQLAREALEDARWDDTTAYNRSRDAAADAWNQKLYDQSEQHYQDTRADSQRNWEHQLAREALEDARYNDETAYSRGRDTVSDNQWQATQDERVREFDLTHGLDQAEYDFLVRQYEDAQGQQAGTGNGGSGGNGGTNDSGNSGDKQPAQNNQDTTAAEKSLNIWAGLNEKQQKEKNATQFIASLYTGSEFARRGKGGYNDYADYIAGEVANAVDSGKLSTDEAIAVLDYYDLNGLSGTQTATSGKKSALAGKKGK